MTTTRATPSASNGRGSRKATPAAEPRRPFAGVGRAKGLRTRPRSRGLITVAAMLVLLFGAGTAYLVTTAGEQASVLAVGTPVAKGRVVEREALISTTVSGVPGAITVDRAAEVIGQTAAIDLVEGQVLTEAMMTSKPTPAEGQAVVGLALEPTKVPAAGLEAGDLVRVLRVTGPDDAAPAGPGEEESGTVISQAATVYAASSDAAGGREVLLTLVLPEAEAAAVAVASTAGQAAAIEISASNATAPQANIQGDAGAEDDPADESEGEE